MVSLRYRDQKLGRLPPIIVVGLSRVAAERCDPDAYRALDHVQVCDDLAVRDETASLRDLLASRTVGVPPRTVVPDEQVAAAREQRVAAQQAAQRAALAESAAKTAQTLSATDTAGQNALTDIARAAGQGVVPV